MTRERAARVAVAGGVLFSGPLLGLLIGFILGGIALPPDPHFNGHAAPGDGFLIIIYAAGGFLISLPISLAFAVKIFLHQPANGNSKTR